MAVFLLLVHGLRLVRQFKPVRAMLLNSAIIVPDLHMKSLSAALEAGNQLV
jgi:hypothetical protein